MAEAVVTVLNKLAVVMANEAQFLGGVGRKVQRMQRELIRIKSGLKDADSKCKGDERVQNWLNELHDVVYRIKDTIGTFFLQVEGHSRKDDSIFQNLIKKVCNKPKQLYFLHKLGNELDDIQVLLEEISKSKVTYGIRDLPLEDKSRDNYLISKERKQESEMAEAVVSVLGKLDVVIANEAQFLGGVGKKVERVQRELIRIKCCLIDADSKCKGDERVQNWLNKLRDVAYRIEDTTDTIFLKLEGHRQKDASILQNLIKKVCNNPKQLYFRHKLGNELDDIQNILEEISKSRLTYGIRDLPVEDKSKGEVVKMPLRRATYSEVDENEVVGLQADKEKILELMRPEKTSRRAVITIVGVGGLGKTTLACMVYRSAKADFDYHIMLSISQQFSLTNLLRKMISKDSVPNDRDETYYVGELKRCLNSQRYLIILDDVWTGDLWNELKEVLPDDKNGSRVLMTTRLYDVAKSVDSKIPPYELNLLNERESQHLLLKKAFPYLKLVEECPKDLLELAPELSNKCKGLPLALIVLGDILATKELSYRAWERVLLTMDWYSDGSGCMQILAISYDDMPYYLKACFKYLASFPEDYVIFGKCLIRMWVAEGFIPLEGTTTMEILAEACLEELAGRSMVQVLSRSANGMIKHFKVHKILRELAMHEAQHENFVTVFSQASDYKKPYKIIRRASLHTQEKNSLFMKYAGPNTRSLLLFVDSYCEMSLEWSNFRLLTVLEIVGLKDNLPMVTSFRLKSLDELIYLKYMGFKNCSIGIFPCSFNRMTTLQTLDVRGTGAKLPNVLWTISTLRHVLCDHYDVRGALDGPISTSDLSHLQTMRWIQPLKTWDRELPLLNNLRKLGVCEVEDWVTITNLLKTLCSLISLGIKARWYESLPVEIIYPKTLPNYRNLQSLYLKGEWSKNVTLDASLFPPCLVKLILLDSELEENPMPEFGKLERLTTLRLGEYVLNYSGVTICPSGFPVLQHLEVTDFNMKDLTVAQGVMPKLTYLQAHSYMKVHLPPELQHVTVDRG